MGYESQTPPAISWIHGKTWLPAKVWLLDVTTEYPKEKWAKSSQKAPKLVYFWKHLRVSYCGQIVPTWLRVYHGDCEVRQS